MRQAAIAFDSFFFRLPFFPEEEGKTFRVMGVSRKVFSCFCVVAVVAWQVAGICIPSHAMGGRHFGSAPYTGVLEAHVLVSNDGFVMILKCSCWRENNCVVTCRNSNS